MKTTIAKIIFILSLLPIIGISHFTLATDKSDKSESKKSVLFVMEAGEGKLLKEKGKVFLTLVSPQPQTLWFYDRPLGGMGYMATKDMIANWHKMFKLSAPNVAVTYSTESYSYDKENRNLVKATHLFKNIVLTCKNPRFTNGILKFEVMPVGDAAKQAIKDNKTLLEVNMFIDGLFSLSNYTPPCCSGMGCCTPDHLQKCPDQYRVNRC